MTTKTDEQMAIALYEAYPRKVGRKRALKEIERCLKREDYQFLMARVVEYSNSKIVKSHLEMGERKYIPHPATWFFQERYHDDPEEWQIDPYIKAGESPPAPSSKPKGQIFRTLDDLYD